VGVGDVRGGARLFDDADRESIRAHGLTVEEAERQIRLLRRPPAFARLLRPCRPGDGISALPPERHEELLAAHARAAAAGRFTKFVPASGAATRMFRDGLAFLDGGGEPPAAVRALLDGLDRMPFRDELRDRLAGRGEDLDRLRAEGRPRPILATLLEREGLNLAARPKALLPFHAYRDGVRTCFEEHLVEAAQVIADAAGVARLHVTLSPGHEPAFRDLLERVRPLQERRLSVRFAVTFSAQSPATDTLALGPDGAPFRDAGGRLLFRAAGHGALIRNLGALGADLVLLKNVDNVAPDRLKGPANLWLRLLLGALVRLQDQAFALCRRLEREPGDRAALAEALALLGRAFHRRGVAPDPGQVLDRLCRPIRVCGMVPNQGEPGGGPFWVRAGAGAELQIVEPAQVDPASGEQQRRFAAGTHFNPVLLACGLRDHRGRPFDLDRWVDAGAVILTRKSARGRDLLALERPGLWNGAMAGWNTVFVEVPGLAFNPVKTVLDLLRPEHQEG
jgi:hypothetical protein